MLKLPQQFPRHLLMLPVAALLACTAADSGSGAPVHTREGAAPEQSVTMAVDWRAEATEAVRSVDAAKAATIAGLEPITTRAGTLRFVGDYVRDPDAAAVFLSRLAAGVEDPALRAALVEALPRTGGAFGAALVGLFGEESDSDVRLAIVHALKRAEPVSAQEGLVLGLADEDPAVREEAARIASYREDGSALAGELSSALSDETPQVRAAAARALGVLEVSEARDAIMAGLADTSASVRLESLRAVGRLDPAFAATLPQTATLAADADPRIAGAAQRLMAQ